MPDLDSLTPDQFTKDANERWAKVSACPLEGVEPPKPRVTTPANSPCRDGQGFVSHDFLGDKCIKCGHVSPPNYNDLLNASMKADNQYAAHLAKSQGESSMSEPSQFTPGQTVWIKGESAGRPKGEIVAISERYKTACVRWADDSLSVRGLDCFTATDPNAKPLPQKCPFCGSAAYVTRSTGSQIPHVQCEERVCQFQGPPKSSEEKAIAAWNSIRIENEAAGDAKREAAEQLERQKRNYQSILDDYAKTRGS